MKNEAEQKQGKNRGPESLQEEMMDRMRDLGDFVCPLMSVCMEYKC